MSSRSRAIGTAFAVLLAVGCSSGPKDLHFTVDFREARDIAKGRPVLYRGVEVGKVESVTLSDGGVRVGLRIKGEHRAAMSRGLRFRIETQDGVRGLLGQRRIVVEDPSAPPDSAQGSAAVERSDAALPRATIGDGETIAGAEPGEEAWAEKAEQAARIAWDAAKGAAAQFEDWARDVGSSPEAKEFGRSIKEYSEKAEKVARDKYGDFQKDELPAIKERARKLKEDLERQGKSEDARKFWEGFNDWLRNAERDPKSGRSGEPNPRSGE